MNSDTPETDRHEAFRDSMDTRAHADYIATLELCKEMERERNEARRMSSIHQDKLARMREQVRLTIMENLHLADWDVCITRHTASSPSSTHMP